MKKKIFIISYKIESLFYLRVIHQALTTMIPFIMAGALSYAIINLPIPAYQTLLEQSYMKWFAVLMNSVNYGSYHFFAPVFVVSISHSYVMHRKIASDKEIFYIISALGAFATALNMPHNDFSMSYLGIEGCFQALVVGFFTCEIFYFWDTKWLSKEEKRRTGIEIISEYAIRMIFPFVMIMGFWACVNYVIELGFDAVNLQDFVNRGIWGLFKDVSDNYAGAVLFTMVLHLLWLFGFHGGWVLEPISVSHFSNIGSDIIFSKEMLDVFVVMGGCGTTICVLITILLFSKKKRLRRLAVTGVFPALFNINEILNFGIPIVLNPILGIPFILVPFEAISISYLAIYTGFCPPVTNEIVWSTPVFYSGYLATGSWKGVLIQLIIIVTGIATYYPFLRANEKMHELHMRQRLSELISQLKQMERDGIAPNFLEQNNNEGLLAKMLLRDLKKAIRYKKLYLLYQPQTDNTGRCIGAEALIRWEHPMFGMIYPPLLIYLAKAGGVLPEVEAQLYDMSCAAIKKTELEGLDDFKISINITAKSLGWEEMEERLDGCLKQYGVKAERLWLEITEQDVLFNSMSALDKISRLREKGHHFLIDDFGMGHTSLIYLQSNLFDVVKIDGSLTKHIEDNITNQKIISSIVSLGKELNVNTIAEFVETQEEKNKLEELGCFWYQGYLYSPAIPLDDFITYLKNHR